ncbi:hypothetical protein ACFL96_01230 [Thermoproteota archaeon]
MIKKNQPWFQLLLNKVISMDVAISFFPVPSPPTLQPGESSVPMPGDSGTFSQSPPPLVFPQVEREPSHIPPLPVFSPVVQPIVTTVVQPVKNGPFTTPSIPRSDTRFSVSSLSSATTTPSSIRTPQAKKTRPAGAQAIDMLLSNLQKLRENPRISGPLKILIILGMENKSEDPTWKVLWKNAFETELDIVIPQIPDAEAEITAYFEVMKANWTTIAEQQKIDIISPSQTDGAKKKSFRTKRLRGKKAKDETSLPKQENPFAKLFSKLSNVIGSFFELKPIIDPCFDFLTSKNPRQSEEILFIYTETLLIRLIEKFARDIAKLEDISKKNKAYNQLIGYLDRYITPHDSHENELVEANPKSAASDAGASEKSDSNGSDNSVAPRGYRNNELVKRLVEKGLVSNPDFFAALDRANKAELSALRTPEASETAKAAENAGVEETVQPRCSLPLLCLLNEAFIQAGESTNYTPRQKAAHKKAASETGKLLIFRPDIDITTLKHTCLPAMSLAELLPLFHTSYGSGIIDSLASTHSEYAPAQIDTPDEIAQGVPQNEGSRHSGSNTSQHSVDESERLFFFLLKSSKGSSSMKLDQILTFYEDQHLIPPAEKRLGFLRGVCSVLLQNNVSAVTFDILEQKNYFFKLLELLSVLKKHELLSLPFLMDFIRNNLAAVSEFLSQTADERLPMLNQMQRFPILLGLQNKLNPDSNIAIDDKRTAAVFHSFSEMKAMSSTLGEWESIMHYVGLYMLAGGHFSSDAVSANSAQLLTELNPWLHAYITHFLYGKADLQTIVQALAVLTDLKLPDSLNAAFTTALDALFQTINKQMDQTVFLDTESMRNALAAVNSLIDAFTSTDSSPRVISKSTDKKGAIETELTTIERFSEKLQTLSKDISGSGSGSGSELVSTPQQTLSEITKSVTRMRHAILLDLRSILNALLLPPLQVTDILRAVEIAKERAANIISINRDYASFITSQQNEFIKSMLKSGASPPTVDIESSENKSGNQTPTVDTESAGNESAVPPPEVDTEFAGKESVTQTPEIDVESAGIESSSQESPIETENTQLTAGDIQRLLLSPNISLVVPENSTLYATTSSVSDSAETEETRVANFLNLLIASITGEENKLDSIEGNLRTKLETLLNSDYGPNSKMGRVLRCLSEDNIRYLFNTIQTDLSQQKGYENLSFMIQRQYEIIINSDTVEIVSRFYVNSQSLPDPSSGLIETDFNDKIRFSYTQIITVKPDEVTLTGRISDLKREKDFANEHMLLHIKLFDIAGLTSEDF